MASRCSKSNSGDLPRPVARLTGASDIRTVHSCSRPGHAVSAPHDRLALPHADPRRHTSGAHNGSAHARTMRVTSDLHPPAHRRPRRRRRRPRRRCRAAPPPPKGLAILLETHEERHYTRSLRGCSAAQVPEWQARHQSRCRYRADAHQRSALHYARGQLVHRMAPRRTYT